MEGMIEEGEKAQDGHPITECGIDVPVTYGAAFMAQRNPIVRSSNSGSAEILALTRNASGRSAHDPPRSTRFSPWAGPVGFFFGLF
jgi:hypothetical protein